MGMLKPSLLLLLLLIATVSVPQKPRIAEARTLPFLPQQNYSKIFATLGVVCKCCDGTDQGDCRSTWTGSCDSLQCLPWKLA